MPQHVSLIRQAYNQTLHKEELAPGEEFQY